MKILWKQGAHQRKKIADLADKVALGIPNDKVANDFSMYRNQDVYSSHTIHFSTRFCNEILISLMQYTSDVIVVSLGVTSFISFNH